MNASDPVGIPNSIAATYDKMAQIKLYPMGMLNARNSRARISPMDGKEILQDLAYSIENVISDLLPDADKDLPRLIAVAVINQLNDDDVLIVRIPTVEPEAIQPVFQGMSILAQNIQSMSMEEYAKIRPKLFAGIMKAPSEEEIEEDE